MPQDLQGSSMGHERWPRCFSVKIGKCAIDLIITTMVDLVCGSAGAVFRRDRVVRHGLAVNAILASTEDLLTTGRGRSSGVEQPVERDTGPATGRAAFRAARRSAEQLLELYTIRSDGPLGMFLLQLCDVSAPSTGLIPVRSFPSL